MNHLGQTAVIHDLDNEETGQLLVEKLRLDQQRSNPMGEEDIESANYIYSDDGQSPP